MNELFDLNKFTKKGEIGHGTFGQVFKIVENDTGNIFAAKISIIKLDENDKKLELNIRREVTILSVLNHPSVLKFIGYSPFDFDQKPHPVIITEYSPNGSLENIIKLEHKSIPPQSWTNTKKLINIYGIASAMKYLHSRNIIHRDLKPANILEDDNFFPKVADFGLSKIYNQNFESMTSQSTVGIKGTPFYIAPEIYSTNIEYTKAVDVYSFAFIVYQLFEFNEPFKKYDFNTFYFKVIVGGERPDFKYMIPSCYKNLIEKCWLADPLKRPTFNEIVNELKTNEEFIIDSIDKEEYFNYIDCIDSFESLNDQSEKIKNENIIITDKNSGEKTEKNYKTITKNDSIEKNTEKIIEEINDESKEKNITVGEFNSLKLDLQYLAICKIIKDKTENRMSKYLLNVQDILKYLLKFQWRREKSYFKLLTKNEEQTVNKILEETPNISLSHFIIEMIKEGTTNDATEITKYLNLINNIYIELEYPTTNFEDEYYEIQRIKKEYEEKVHLIVYIKGHNKTDNKFQNDRNIDKVIIEEPIEEITGSQIGFKNSGGGSFYGCLSLTEIKFPTTLKNIGEYSFSCCSSLLRLIIPGSVANIGEGAFSGCSSLIQIIFELPSSITSIKFYTFFGCSSLTEIEIPSSVTEIEKDSFARCQSLTQVSIHSPNFKIGKGVFNNCKIINLFNTEMIPPYAFSKYTNLTEIKIPSSVTKIGYNAFEFCTSLTQITLPSSITEIGYCAFQSCSSLKQISIPPSVIGIWYRTFCKCSSLKQIIIPSSVTTIADYAFSCCSSLTQIKIPSSVEEIGKCAFSGCSSLTQISIPSSIKVIMNYSFGGCNSLTQITIPSSIKMIEEGAFYECTSLTEIEIPSSVVFIGDHAFEQCSSLKQISIPSSITTIGNYTFGECSSLKQILLPSSVKEIGDFAFGVCSSLSQISVPSSVTSIGEGAFYECSSLTQISIPSSVTEIKNYTFKGCKLLTKISIPSSISKIGYHVFEECPFVFPNANQ